MNVHCSETIAAKVTPPGKGGVGIIRISGPLTATITTALLGRVPPARVATLSTFMDNTHTPIDQGLALFFPKPNSFTGEDVLELQGHGGPIVLDMLLQRILSLGARVARPGEFSERAFLNNKIDLTQAEAIADLIDASSTAAARAAMQSLQGHFAAEINRLVAQVIELRVYVEAAIDFPDEEIDFLSDGNILERLETIQAQTVTTLNKTTQGAALNEGLKVVIIGYPNAGKSSLLNYLSGEETAIVSDSPGTTRDVIKQDILIDGMPLKIIDTAGLRVTTDHIEVEGIKRAWREIEQADRLLLVIDASQTTLNDLIEQPFFAQFVDYLDRLVIIRNKMDLLSEDANFAQDELNVINVSVKTGYNMALLKQYLKDCIGYEGQETVYVARRRHVQALKKAQTHFQLAHEQLVVYRAGELVAEELRQAQTILAEITGEFRSDDLLGNIFSSFCIGK